LSETRHPDTETALGAIREAAAAFEAEAVEGIGHLRLDVRPADWVAVHIALRDHPATRMAMFSWLTLVDFCRDDATADCEVRAGMGSEAAPDETMVEEWAVLTRLWSAVHRFGVNLRTAVGRNAPALPTLSTVYPGANWHERHAHEMFGFTFEGHPDLRKLYLPSEFEGYPLRKTFPLLSRLVKPWPGLVDVEGMPSEEDEEAAAAPGEGAAEAAGAPASTQTEPETAGHTTGHSETEAAAVEEATRAEAPAPAQEPRAAESAAAEGPGSAEMSPATDPQPADAPAADVSRRLAEVAAVVQHSAGGELGVALIRVKRCGAREDVQPIGA